MAIDYSEKQRAARAMWAQLDAERQKDPDAFTAKTKSGPISPTTSAHRDRGGEQAQAIAFTRTQISAKGGDALLCEQICNAGDRGACIAFQIALKRLQGKGKPTPPTSCRKA